MCLPFFTKESAAGADFLSWRPLPLKQNLAYHSQTKLMRNEKASTNMRLPPISQAKLSMAELSLLTRIP